MLIEFIILVLAVPVGFLIAKLTSDELEIGKKYFRVLVILSVILGLWFYLIGWKAEAWTMSFIFIVSFVSLMKSEDRKWLKE